MTHDPQTTFRALADPTRRNILNILSAGGQTIGQIADQFETTRTAIKKHLTILEQGDLITVTAQGRERINKLNPQGFLPAVVWLTVFDTFWDDRLATLKSTIEKDVQ